MPREALKDLIVSFSPDRLVTFLRRRSTNFRQAREEYTEFSREQFRDVTKIGDIKFTDEMKSNLIVITARAMKPLSERSGKRRSTILQKRFCRLDFLMLAYSFFMMRKDPSASA